MNIYLTYKCDREGRALAPPIFAHPTARDARINIHQREGKHGVWMPHPEPSRAERGTASYEVDGQSRWYLDPIEMSL